MATKPNASDSNYDIPTSWSDINTKTRPSADKITLGWRHKEKPPYQYFNWNWDFECRWLKWTETSIDELANIQRREIFQLAHGFLNHFVYYDKYTSLWTKAIATSTSSLATHFAVRIDDDNFYAYNLGELPTTGILDESNAALTKDTYYYLSDSVAGKCTSTKPTINEEQICFKVNDTYLTLFPSYCPGLFTEFSKLNGDSSENFSVADGTVDTHAVNLGQLNAKFPYVSYSVNYGNTDANGYADLIEKISDTEVAFKVGGAYPNMGVTFPNGKHYEISEIPNVSGLDSDGLYKYCIFESNLAKLENGTYRGLITSVSATYHYYDNINILTGFTSNTKGGITVSATHGGSNAYLAVDGNSGTGWSGAGGQTYYNPYPFVPGSGGVVDYFIDFDTPKSFWKFSIKQRGNWYGYGELYFSGDAGNTWTKACDFSGNNNGTETAYVFSEFKNMPINKVRVRFTGLGYWHTYGSEVHAGMDIYSMGLYETVTFEGVQITEGYTAPAEREDGDLHCYTNQQPLKPVLYIDGQEIEAQFVEIGKATKIAGTLGTPINYPLGAQFVGSTGLEMDMGSDFYTIDLDSGNKLVKRAF